MYYWLKAKPAHVLTCMMQKNASPKEKMKRSSTFVVNFEHVCSKFAASAGKTGIGNSHIVKMRIEIRDIGIFVSFCMYR